MAGCGYYSLSQLCLLFDLNLIEQISRVVQYLLSHSLTNTSLTYLRSPIFSSSEEIAQGGLLALRRCLETLSSGLHERI